MSETPKRFEIGKGTYILDTSGVASEGEQMKRQADYSFELVKEAFSSGKLRIVAENGSATTSQPDRHENTETE